eukprot:TRINITY_DN1417_c0_g1_i8.p2 TRINITY_DN1417_c0_g1~~TRINITY_DN1417_c0_g1_i8.p2  ORF type:complete len:570 (-),score=280.90 TRINITY_DN1417_c0_g1_i8:155-1864(-)
MQRSLFVISAGCAATSALAATRHSNTAAKFLAAEAPAPVKLAQHQAKDANWDGLSVQNNDTYASDYVKDEAPAPDNATFVKHEQWPKKGRWTIEPTSDKFGSARRWAGKSEAWEGSSSSDDSSSSGGGDITSSGGFGGHSPQWYVDKCEAISAACAAEQDATVEKFERDLSDLEAEYRRQLRILDGKEEDHADEVADVKAQKIAVKKQKMKVADAKKAVEENAHCPPELQEAKEKLYQLEAVPNKTPEDIEEECQQKKIVMEKEKCVEVLLAAEEVLSDEREDHGEEKDDLHEEHGEEADAAAALPPQEKRVADAKAAWEAAKAKGPKTVTHAGKEGCQKDKDALLAALEADIRALEEEYRRQKRILAGKEDDHAQEKSDVDAQEDEVAKQKKKVDQAKVAVKNNAHCPPELEDAKAKLFDLEAVPNETPEDIEEECAARKLVLEKEQCVEVLLEAQQILREEEGDHAGEKHELKGEEKDEQVAADALPPQEKRVAKAKAALDAALAALEALKNCVNGGKSSEPADSASKSGGDGADSSSSDNSAEGGSVHAAAGSALALVVVAVLACF